MGKWPRPWPIGRNYINGEGKWGSCKYGTLPVPRKPNWSGDMGQQVVDMNEESYQDQHMHCIWKWQKTVGNIHWRHVGFSDLKRWEESTDPNEECKVCAWAIL